MTQVSNLVARATGSKQARLLWTPAPGAGSYLVYRHTADDFGAATLLETLGPASRHFNDYADPDGLIPATPYFWWIQVPGGIPVMVTISTPEASVKGPTYRSLMDALEEWVTTATDLKVIWKDQPAPELKKPYVMLSLTGPFKSGTDWPRDADEGIAGMRSYMVGVQVFTDPIQVKDDPADDTLDAMQYAADLVNSLETPDVMELLVEAGIGLGQAQPVNDLSDMLGTKAERRAQFDFAVNVPSNVPVSGPVIDKVETVEMIS